MLILIANMIRLHLIQKFSNNLKDHLSTFGVFQSLKGLVIFFLTRVVFWRKFNSEKVSKCHQRWPTQILNFYSRFATFKISSPDSVWVKSGVRQLHRPTRFFPQARDGPDVITPATKGNHFPRGTYRSK